MLSALNVYIPTRDACVMPLADLAGRRLDGSTTLRLLPEPHKKSLTQDGVW